MENLIFQNFGNIAKSNVVASCHPESHSIGISILKAGGNAIDAFIATTFGDYVVAPGTTSMAGALYVLFKNTKTSKVMNLSGSFKTPFSQNGIWQNNNDPIAKKVLIPGAIAGLNSLHKKYGNMPWDKLLEPAIDLAENGFELSPLYENVLNYRKQFLFSSQYFRNLFLRDNRLLKSGELLKQPILARTLKGIQKDGADYFYRGEWGCNFLKTINKLGGKLILDDISQYEPTWNSHLINTYRDYKFFSPGGLSFGGIKFALAMKILECFDIRKLGHWSKNIDSLELMIKVARQIESEQWIYDYQKLNDNNFIKTCFSAANVGWLCCNLNHSMRHYNFSKHVKHSHLHSAQTVIIDKNGTIVTGMHTIGSYPWGDAIFVDGVALNNSACLANSIPPGHYVPDASSLEIFEKNEKVILAGGFISSSMFPADYQVILNILDFNMTPKQALSSPRFGSFFIDDTIYPVSVDFKKNIIDERYSKSMLRKLQQRGILVGYNKYNDTGMGVVIKIDTASGHTQAAVSEELNGVEAEF